MQLEMGFWLAAEGGKRYNKGCAEGAREEGKTMRINVTRSSMPSFEEYCGEIRDLWDSRWLTNNGGKVQALSAQLCVFLQSAQVELFSNGHMALEALLSTLPEKGEVITTPFTFASTVHAIVRKGLTPVFADIRQDDYTIDVEQVEKLITDKTCAILPVHVYGRLCDVDRLEEISRKYHIPVIYDAAHAFGVTRNGVSAARFGLASMFSFHATKVYHTIEGGCVATQSAELAEKLELERNYGITGPEDVVSVGGNAKMNEFQAAMGLCNLRHLSDDIRGRKAVHACYMQALSGLDNIILPAPQPDVESNYAYFPVVFENREVRDRVCAALLEEGVYARKYFYPLITDFECYRGLPGFDSAKTPVAQRVSDGVVTLPMYPDLALSDVRMISDVIRRTVSHG